MQYLLPGFIEKLLYKALNVLYLLIFFDVGCEGICLQLSWPLLLSVSGNTGLK